MCKEASVHLGTDDDDDGLGWLYEDSRVTLIELRGAVEQLVVGSREKETGWFSICFSNSLVGSSGTH